MSFVSQLLERLGVVRQPGLGDEEDTSDAPTEPPGQALEGSPRGHTDIPTLSPGQFEQPAFDPERTISSLDDYAAPEHTLVAAPSDTTQPGTATPAPPATRSTTLDALLAERGLKEHASIGDLGVDVDALLERPLEEAYADAGLPPARQDCAIEDVVTAIRAGRSQGLTPVQLRFKVEATVVDAGGSLRDVAADAAAKDEVLDALQSAIEDQVEARDVRLAQRAEALQRQIQALQAQRDNLLADAASERNRYAHWCERKQAVEREWADALDVLAPFV